MMSHTIMSSDAGAPRHLTSTVFFVTFVPTVAMYRSSNSSCTNRLIREVFPTATSPTRHTFALRCFCPATAGENLPQRKRAGEHNAERQATTDLVCPPLLEKNNESPPRTHPADH